MSKTITPKVLITKFTEDSVKGYIEALEEIESTFSASQKVLIHIDSYGGSVHGLLMLIDKLESMSNIIVTYTSSKAMSAGAFLLSIAGTPGYRFASEDASILVHEVQSGAIGDIKDVEDAVIHTKRLNDRLLTKFAKSIGRKKSEDIRKMIKEKALGHDMIFSSEEAKKIGIIDRVCTIGMKKVSYWDIKEVEK